MLRESVLLKRTRTEMIVPTFLQLRRPTQATGHSRLLFGSVFDARKHFKPLKCEYQDYEKAVPTSPTLSSQSSDVGETREHGQ